MQRAIVTAGSGRIGPATAAAVGARGGMVVPVAGRVAETAKDVELGGGTAVVVLMDVTGSAVDFAQVLTAGCVASLRDRAAVSTSVVAAAVVARGVVTARSVR
jgi:NAD(P)-dependent dehydrogenase (short-subunit alcohol dehydrogenase family)